MLNYSGMAFLFVDIFIYLDYKILSHDHTIILDYTR